MTQRRCSWFAIAVLTGLGIAACTSSADDATVTTTTQPPNGSSAPAATTTSVAPVVDEFELALRRRLAVPALPSFSLPLDVFADDRDDAIGQQLGVPPGLYEGIAVVDARCDDSGAVTAADAGAPRRGSDGSGSYDNGPVSIRVQGDGSGSYRDGAKTIVIQSDGSGSLRDGAVVLDIEGDGSGTYTDATRALRIDGNGSGSYRDADVQVRVDVNGSASYRDAATTVTRTPDGRLDVVGDREHADAIGRVLAERFPKFPAVPRVGLPPPPSGRSCGTVIRLDASVLFDFGLATINPAAQDRVDRVAALLVALGSPSIDVAGHTDSIGSDEFNLDLSRRRADAVAEVLVTRGVARTSITTVGYGETRPLEPNTTPDGADDPAARQRNRRVEIILKD